MNPATSGQPRGTVDGARANIAAAPSPAPLIQAGDALMERVAHYRTQVRAFYFLVLREKHRCPNCSQRMEVAAADAWRCACGAAIDPTETFLESPCCGARVMKRRSHYACTDCGKPVRSPFLFDERLYDHAYFRERMREARQRKHRKREALRKLLAATRSQPVHLEEAPAIAQSPGLSEALAAFLGTAERRPSREDANVFHLEQYRSRLLAALDGGEQLFSALPLVAPPRRLDRTRRFLTLLHMAHAGEIVMTQYGSDILVEAHEAHG